VLGLAVLRNGHLLVVSSVQASLTIDLLKFQCFDDTGAEVFVYTGLGEDPVLAVDMLSGATWTLSFGDLLIVIALALLFVEILKATRPGSRALVDHMLSMVLFVVFLVEFLLVPGAATQVFFILMTISLIDVVAGFAVSIRTASRDVSIGL